MLVRILLVVYILMLTIPLKAAELGVEEALLYTDGATLIAKSIAYVHEGRNFIGFVPSDVEKNSISIAANCDKAHILGVDLGNIKKTDKYRKIQREIEELKRQKGALLDKLRFYEALVSSLERSYRGANIAVFEKRFEMLSAKMQTLKSKVADLDREIKKKEKHLKSLEKKQPLYVWATAEDECEFTIGYRTRFARWKPRYLLSFSENGNVTLTLFAEIRQDTGEDWKGVSVTLSSSPPTRYLFLPQIKPFYIGELKTRALTAGVRFNVEKRITGFSYSIPTQVDISSGQRHLFILKRYQWSNAQFEKELFAFHKPLAVYTVLSISRPKEPLPDGEVEVVEDNFFIGRTRLGSIEEEGRLIVPLGADQDLKVSKKLLEYKVKEKWNEERVIEVAYAIRIYNGKDEGVNVKVVDTFPVSTDARIKVKWNMDEIVPQPYTITKDGIAYWNVSVAPSQAKEIVVRYSITYPGDMIINFDMSDII